MLIDVFDNSMTVRLFMLGATRVFRISMTVRLFMLVATKVLDISMTFIVDVIRVLLHVCNNVAYSDTHAFPK